MSTSLWDPADHATYCPQFYPRPPDAGGSSWLCVCSGPLVELRAAGQALIDAAPTFGSNSWAEAYGVWEDVVAEQERLETEAGAASVDGWRTMLLRNRPELADLAAEDRAATVHLYGEERMAELEWEAALAQRTIDHRRAVGEVPPVERDKVTPPWKLEETLKETP